MRQPNKDAKEQNRERSRKYQAKWRASYPEAAREKSRKWAALHPEAVRESARKSMAKWRALHPEAAKAKWAAWAAKNLEAARENSRKWRALHPEKRREENRRRVAQTSNHVDYQAILLRDGMQCYLCGQLIASMADLHFDHVVPLSKEGLHTEENVKVTHAKCNLSKGSKILCVVAE